MANWAQVKGKKFERDLLAYLRAAGLDADRLRDTGTEDEGDLVVRSGEANILQAKARKGYDLAFLKDAKEQAEFYAKHRSLAYTPPAFLVMKRKNYRLGQAYVVQEVDQWIEGLKS